MLWKIFTYKEKIKKIKHQIYQKNNVIIESLCFNASLHFETLVKKIIHRRACI